MPELTSYELMLVRFFNKYTYPCAVSWAKTPESSYCDSRNSGPVGPDFKLSITVCRWHIGITRVECWHKAEARFPAKIPKKNKHLFCVWEGRL